MLGTFDHRGHYSSAFWAEILWGRRAILSVDSLNNEGGKHAIFWNGMKILDPQNGTVFDGITKKFFTESATVHRHAFGCDSNCCELEFANRMHPSTDWQ